MELRFGKIELLCPHWLRQRRAPLPDGVALHVVDVRECGARCGPQPPLHWRLLDGMLPIAGLMTFAWSPGTLFTLAQEFQTTQLSRIHKRRAERQAHKRREHAVES